MPAVHNHDLTFRPLRCGVTVYNPLCTVPGTVACFARDGAGAGWLVSCRHVLGRPAGAAFGDGEPVYQPYDDIAGAVVARTVAAMSDAGLDCAAARLDPGIVAMNEAVGIGPVGPPIPPVAGNRVTKAGRATGVTEGVIDQVAGDIVTIVPMLGFGMPVERYELSLPGDSGGLWVDLHTRMAV